MSVQSVTMARINHEKVIWTLIATCLVLIVGVDGGRTLTDLEIRRQLKQLNKPAVKSFKSDVGIVDCVDIYKQPAFDHPLLKNHTIKMRPSDYDSEKYSSEPIEQPWRKGGSCPEGTIPIIRTQKSDLLRRISVENSAAPAFENAKLYVDADNRGGEAYINVWNIHVEPGESSTSSIFVATKDHPDLINIGWMVSPTFFGDNITRLFAYWASDNGAGCYNLQCPGFIQTDKYTQLGGSLFLSVYGGDQQYIAVIVDKDLENNWWFVYNLRPIGYWPGILFKNMESSANMIQWGGQVWNTAPGGRHTNTQMGSGHFPNDGHTRAAFIYRCFYRDLFTGHSIPDGNTKATTPSCYDISTFRSVDNYGFHFGGPGGAGCDE